MLNNDINSYVEMKRAMGFKYRVQNGLLQHYVRFAEQYDATFVRIMTVIEWAGMAPSLHQKRNRLLTVRRFSLAMHPENNQYELPPIRRFWPRGSKT